MSAEVQDGGESYFRRQGDTTGGVTAPGGGAGGSVYQTAIERKYFDRAQKDDLSKGKDGGSGGGGTDGLGGGNRAGTDTVYGNKGASGKADYREQTLFPSGQRSAAGGGGGAVHAGFDSTTDDPNAGGAGGQGFKSDISGAPVFYGAGGGGGYTWFVGNIDNSHSQSTPGLGGSGFGGDAADIPHGKAATSGVPNTGAGGGGGSFNGLTAFLKDYYYRITESLPDVNEAGQQRRRNYFASYERLRDEGFFLFRDYPELFVGYESKDGHELDHPSYVEGDYGEGDPWISPGTYNGNVLNLYVERYKEQPALYKGGNGSDGIVIVSFDVQGTKIPSPDPIIALTDYDFKDTVADIDYRVSWAGENAGTVYNKANVYAEYIVVKDVKDGTVVTAADFDNPASPDSVKTVVVSRGQIGVDVYPFKPTETEVTYWVRLKAVALDADGNEIEGKVAYSTNPIANSADNGIASFYVPTLKLNGAMWAPQDTSEDHDENRDHAVIGYNLYMKGKNVHLYCYWASEVDKAKLETYSENEAGVRVPDKTVAPVLGDGVYRTDIGTDRSDLTSFELFPAMELRQTDSGLQQVLEYGETYYVRIAAVTTDDKGNESMILSEEILKLASEPSVEFSPTANPASWDNYVARVDFTTNIDGRKPSDVKLVALYVAKDELNDADNTTITIDTTGESGEKVVTEAVLGTCDALAVGTESTAYFPLYSLGGGEYYVRLALKTTKDGVDTYYYSSEQKSLTLPSAKTKVKLPKRDSAGNVIPNQFEEKEVENKLPVFIVAQPARSKYGEEIPAGFKQNWVIKYGFDGKIMDEEDFWTYAQNDAKDEYGKLLFIQQDTWLYVTECLLYGSGYYPTDLAHNFANLIPEKIKLQASETVDGKYIRFLSCETPDGKDVCWDPEDPPTPVGSYEIKRNDVGQNLFDINEVGGRSAFAPSWGVDEHDAENFSALLIYVPAMYTVDKAEFKAHIDNMTVQYDGANHPTVGTNSELEEMLKNLINEETRELLPDGQTGKEVGGAWDFADNKFGDDVTDENGSKVPEYKFYYRLPGEEEWREGLPEVSAITTKVVPALDEDGKPLLDTNGDPLYVYGDDGSQTVQFKAVAPNHVDVVGTFEVEITPWDYKVKMDGDEEFSTPIYIPEEDLPTPDWLKDRITDENRYTKDEEGNNKEDKKTPGYLTDNDKRYDSLHDDDPNDLPLWQNYVVGRKNRRKKIIPLIEPDDGDDDTFTVFVPDLVPPQPGDPNLPYGSGVVVMYRLDEKLVVDGYEKFVEGTLAKDTLVKAPKQPKFKVQLKRKEARNGAAEGDIDPTGVYRFCIVIVPVARDAKGEMLKDEDGHYKADYKETVDGGKVTVEYPNGKSVIESPVKIGVIRVKSKTPNTITAVPWQDLVDTEKWDASGNKKNYTDERNNDVIDEESKLVAVEYVVDPSGIENTDMIVAYDLKDVESDDPNYTPESGSADAGTTVTTDDKAVFRGWSFNKAGESDVPHAKWGLLETVTKASSLRVREMDRVSTSLLAEQNRLVFSKIHT